ncbi:hypothetical protein NQ317_008329 [Molorchus minor]|uniref:Uncharacterized protein n=1 Tax=Molorchus minor TaxID=1323400 RepID=A0ABQ9JRJ5_9CUCU|nr:hypothetical protein NQ317_008329 [Molorchus minor]
MERNKALEETNKELLQKLDNYKELESKITTPIANQCNMEDVISEIIDRQSRATNVIIFNVNESSNNTKVGRLQDDREAVINILEDYAVDKTDLKLFRLGKISPNKMRPIKLTLKSAEEAKYILRNKLVKTPGIKIVADQTKAQQEYFKKVRADLLALEDNTKTIKFINNKPTIVNKQLNAWQKN